MKLLKWYEINGTTTWSDQVCKTKRYINPRMHGKHWNTELESSIKYAVSNCTHIFEAIFSWFI